MTLKKLATRFALVTLVAALPNISAAAVPHTFAAGDPIRASEVNSNFTDLDTRSTANASGVGTNSSDISVLNTKVTTLETPDVAGYSLPFAADGAPKSVIVRKQDNGDGTITYNIETRYANSSEMVSVEGVQVIRPFIENWYWVTVDAAGTLTSMNNYIEAPLTTNHSNFVIEESTFDVLTLAKTVTQDTRSELWDCSLGAGVITHCGVDRFDSGAPLETFNFFNVRQFLGAGSVNAIPFDNLVGETSTYSSGSRYRVRAKGLGEVLRILPGAEQKPRFVIYYQANGVTGGSLTGTIFAPGQQLDGILF
jgi:hypothetical protein